MQPTNAREQEIKDKVDRKAGAIRRGLGRWDDSIITEMKVAVGFVLSESDVAFLENYVAWLRHHELKSN
jgi:hypothetical protein